MNFWDSIKPHSNETTTVLLKYLVLITLKQCLDIRIVCRLEVFKTWGCFEVQKSLCKMSRKTLTAEA